MNWTQAIIVFFCLWWVVWLAVLPIGVKRVENPEPLHDPGAPEHPHFLPKFIASTVLAALLTFAIMQVVDSGWINLDVDDPNL